MAFTGRVLTLVALMQIDLPHRTVRLCDGGFVDWDGNRFDCVDPDFGTVKSAESFAEKTGDEAPGGKITFLPPSSAAARSLTNEEYQNCRMRFWFGEIDPATGAIIGAPELTADLAIDTASLKRSRGIREVDIEFESAAKRLFLVMRGQALSDRFHRQCFPGERGMENCTGMPRSTTWGADNPA